VSAQSIKPTESELEILQILWQHGSATVRFINDQLNLKKKVGYTTTLKIMQIMAHKGLLNRKKQGKSHIYSPVIKEKETQSVLLDKLLDTAFGGSAMNLVMQALGNHKTSKEEIKKIKAFIEQLEGDQK